MRRAYIQVALFCLVTNMPDGLAQETQQERQRTGERARIEALLKKAQAVVAYRSKVVVTIQTYRPGTALEPSIMTRTITSWQKGEYQRMDGHTSVAGQSGTAIIRPDGYYQQTEGSEMYTRMPIPPNFSIGTNTKWAGLLDNPTLHILGTEVMDGKEATAIEYIVYAVGNYITVKVWLWNEHGLPLKQITEQPEEPRIPRQVVTTEYSEYVFGDIPDSTFDIPTDKVQELPADWHL